MRELGAESLSLVYPSLLDGLLCVAFQPKRVLGRAGTDSDACPQGLGSLGLLGDLVELTRSPNVRPLRVLPIPANAGLGDPGFVPTDRSNGHY